MDRSGWTTPFPWLACKMCLQWETSQRTHTWTATLCGSSTGTWRRYAGHGGGLLNQLTRHGGQNAGRTVAKMIAHPGSKPEPFVPVFWSALGSQLRYCGNTVGGYDDVVIHGDVEKPAFVAYYTRGETVVAAASMGKDPAVMRVRELMRLQQLPSKSELLGGLDMQQAGVPSQAVL